MGAKQQSARGPTLSPLLSVQDFTPEKKAVVRAPRRGPLAGRKKKVEVVRFVVLLFVIFFPPDCLWETLRDPLHGHQAV